MPRFYFDVLNGDRVSEDPIGIDFVDPATVIAGAHEGARNLVAHGILSNKNLSQQVFVIRDENGATVATVPFKGALPGRLREITAAL